MLPTKFQFIWRVSEEKIKMWKVNRRRTPSDGKSSPCLWQGELKMDNPDTRTTIGKRHRTNTNKIKINTPQYKKNISNKDSTNPDGNVSCSRFLQDNHLLLIVKSGKCIRRYRKNKKSSTQNGYFVTVNQIVMMNVKFLHQWLQPRRNCLEK